MRTIQYAIDTSTGLVVSRVGSVLGWPILEYDKMLLENNFETSYHLEKIRIIEVVSSMAVLNRTRKIPKRIKNLHRKFWGFPLITK